MSRPTYIVAVCDGDILMGYSPNSLTVCTNGASALADTPDMQMAAGPPSPNDGTEQKFHRHMYFVDGSVYKRLDAHTGTVSDWESFNGTDAISGDTLAGLMPFDSDYEDAIVSNTSSTIVVAGDATSIIADGDEVAIQSSTGADGFYTVSGTPVFSSPNTTITVSETIPDTTGDGNVAHVTGRSPLLAFFHNRALLTIGPTYFLSAVGDPRNWDYSPVSDTVTKAVAGNLSEASDVGEEIIAVVVFNDDLVVFGCRSSIWAMNGDPAAGGFITNISRQIGFLGADSWTLDPANMLYFMGTDGLYRYSPNGGLEKVSRGRLDTSLGAVNLEDTRVLMAWDRAREYLWIFLSKTSGTNPASYLYDARSDAFWPVKLPDTNGPASVLYFEADDYNDRGVLLGGRDGFIRSFRDKRPNDSTSTANVAADTAIETYVTMGPMQLDPAVDGVITELRFVLAENSGPVTLRAYGGTTPEQAAQATTPRMSHVFRTGGSRWINRRVAANSVVIELYQNALFTTWAMDDGEFAYSLAGRTRRSRHA